MIYPRIMVRCYAAGWLATYKSNFAASGWTPKADPACPIAGFYMIESYPHVNLSRLKQALDSAREMGFVAIPGMVWHIGSGEPDPAKKHLRWLMPEEWSYRADHAAPLLSPSFQGPLLPDARPKIYLDFELYDSTGQEHASWSQFQNVYKAAAAMRSLAGADVILTQWLPGSCQNTAASMWLPHITWVDEEFWPTSQKSGARLQEDLDQMDQSKRVLQSVPRREYMPQFEQDILRDYAAPVREAVASKTDVSSIFCWLYTGPEATDHAQFGSLAWKTRPQEPIVPPDPAAMGLMAFDLQASNLPLGPCVSFAPTPGSVAPVFNATVAAQVVSESAPVAGQVLRFVPTTPGQGFRANLGRQLSADYTLVFVGLPPQWRIGNDGTGWQLGPQRFTVTQQPAARWVWGRVYSPATENKRHVIVCEQRANGVSTILLDGVQAGTATSTPPQPDGTMAIGTNDVMTPRHVRMDLERLTLFEGVDRDKSMELSRRYCNWYGVDWRGGE